MRRFLTKQHAPGQAPSTHTRVAATRFGHGQHGHGAGPGAAPQQAAGSGALNLGKEPSFNVASHTQAPGRKGARLGAEFAATRQGSVGLGSKPSATRLARGVMPGRFCGSIMQLGVAVCAHQFKPFWVLVHLVQIHGTALALAAVTVVEVERPQTPAISTALARATKLGHKLTFHRSPSCVNTGRLRKRNTPPTFTYSVA